MKNVLIVTNFNAGRKQALKYKKQVIKFVLKHTTQFKFTDIDELKEFDVSPFDTILVMGGDGTVNRVLPYLVNTDKVLGIIPCGTANLLAANLGLSYNLKNNLKIIEKGNIKSVDTFSVDENIVSLRLGFGYDADIICKTPQSLKNKFGYFAYFIAGILFGWRLKKKNYSLIIDGEEKETEASCVIIANCPNMYKKMAYLGNNSKPDDGILEVFILKTSNPVRYFFEFLGILLNIRRNNGAAEYLKGTDIVIKTSWLVGHIDGEKKNFKEDIKIGVKPKSLKVFCKN